MLEAYDDTVGKVKRTYEKHMPFLPGQKGDAGQRCGLVRY